MRRFYWIKEGLTLAGSVLLATVAYGLIMALMNGEDKTLMDHINLSIFYFALVGAMLTMMFNITAYQTILPLALSFGATRKEVRTGMQIYRLSVILPLLAILALALAMTASSRATESWVILLLELAALTLFSGVGCVLGTLVQKLGPQAASRISVLVSFGVMIIAGGAMAFAFIATDAGYLAVWIGLALGIAVYIGCSIYEGKVIRNFCVR